MLVTEITIVTNRTWKGKEVGWGQLIQERESPLRASKDLAGGTLLAVSPRGRSVVPWLWDTRENSSEKLFLVRK